MAGSSPSSAGAIPRGPWWASSVSHIALLAALCIGVYANNFHHEFQLDDSHVLTSNLAVRSLANVPSFFTDPGTFTSLRANVDYRPVLQATYALNYWMGGYETFWWHLTQIALHFVCVLGLYYLCRRILLLNGVRPDDRATLTLVPLLAALVFAVHPTESGVVNYLSARSSLLTAAFLLPSIVLYLRPFGDPRYQRTQWASALLFALALFSKVEAIGCLALYLLFDVWQTAAAGKHQRNFVVDALNTLNARTLRRLWPMLAVSAVYFVVRLRLMAPFQLEDARRLVGVSSFEYLLTQTVVWWQYVLNWIAPLHLVADQGNHPIYRSIGEGPVTLAITGWLAVGAFLMANWKRWPYLLFLAVSALGLLSPTSSIAPLAEMLNEHRPYLPIAVLSLAWMVPLGTAAVSASRTRPAIKWITGAVAMSVLTTLGVTTWQRNGVFATQRSYLEDIVAKEPSGRALNNYGLIFLREGNFPKALDYFTQALKYTPFWHPVHINLAVANRGLGRLDDAAAHFDLAVQYDTYSGTALAFRGENYLGLKRYQEAARDFEEAGPKSLERYRLAKGLATAYAGMGNAQRSFGYTKECLALDSTQTVLDATAIAEPYFDVPERAEAGLAYFEAFDKQLPNTWWIQYNIGTLAGKLGDSARMTAAQARGLALKNAK